MVWVAIVIAGIGMLIYPLGTIYIEIQKKKINNKFADDKVRGKYLLVFRIISIVVFVIALLILNGLIKDLQTHS